MGRPQVPNARVVPVTVKMSRTDLRYLDQVRGGVSRSGYLRWLLQKDRLRLGAEEDS